MIDIGILLAIAVGIAGLLYSWNKRRRATAATQKPVPETQIPPPSTPEEKLALRLLDKIKAGSAQLYFGSLESRQVLTAGIFWSSQTRCPRRSKVCVIASRTISPKRQSKTSFHQRAMAWLRKSRR